MPGWSKSHSGPAEALVLGSSHSNPYVTVGSPGYGSMDVRPADVTVEHDLEFSASALFAGWRCGRHLGYDGIDLAGDLSRGRTSDRDRSFSPLTRVTGPPLRRARSITALGPFRDPSGSSLERFASQMAQYARLDLVG